MHSISPSPKAVEEERGREGKRRVKVLQRWMVLSLHPLDLCTRAKVGRGHRSAKGARGKALVIILQFTDVKWNPVNKKAHFLNCVNLP